MAEDQESDTECQDQLAPLPLPCTTVRHGSSSHKGHVVLLMDVSGSMRSIDAIVQLERGQISAISRLEAATKCAIKFVHAHAGMNPRDRFSLATFADAAVLEGQALSAAQMQAALEGVVQRGMGGTSYVAALQVATELITSQPAMKSHVVFLSDGRPADTKVAL